MENHGLAAPATGTHRARWRAIAVVIAAVLALLAPQVAHAAPDGAQGEEPDLEIVAGARALSQAEIRSHDVTDRPEGASILRRARQRGSDAATRTLARVYVFGDQELIVSAATPLEVVEGRNAEGEVVHQIAPTAQPAEIAPTSGYAVPPSSAWRFNKDGYFDVSVGTWYREVWWTITKANDWKASGSTTAHDYYRIHGKLRAAAVTGAKSYEGYKRAWLEFQRSGTWPSVASFESDRPQESYAGTANQTTTVGFGTSFGVNIGVPPVTASGSVNSSYGGSMTRSSENWHPIIRTTVGNGGVQWCRYESAEFTGTKMIATRTGVRIGSSATPGSWSMLTGQQDYTSSCPSQM
jgi:hypothetical protein